MATTISRPDARTVASLTAERDAHAAFLQAAEDRNRRTGLERRLAAQRAARRNEPR